MCGHSLYFSSAHMNSVRKFRKSMGIFSIFSGVTKYCCNNDGDNNSGEQNSLEKYQKPKNTLPSIYANKCKFKLHDLNV